MNDDPARLRILHALSTCEFAGTERHVAQLSALQAQSCDVTVLLERETCDARTGGDITQHLAPSVRVIRAGRWGYLVSLAQLWRSGHYDIIHTHLGRASARATWLRRLGIGGKTPLLATLHTRYRERSYGTHDALICIARWQFEELPQAQKQRARIVPNWTAVEVKPSERSVLRDAVRKELGLPQHAFLVVAAGRMVEEKGFKTLIKAWGAARRPAGAALVFVGDGPQRLTLEAMSRESTDIHFMGYRKDMPSLFAGFDAFVMPSHHEPFGLVLLEAMAAGLPVRATAAGGVLDILADAPECFIEPENLQAMVGALEELCASSSLRDWDMALWRPDVQAARVADFYRTLTSKASALQSGDR
ncbi:lipopolysaccharide core biosynthesis glycosyl transferase [Neokomagataea thailandica NBRC 106555]|uniref:Glycosyltransferase n=2 Tax=Neokomagataea TaxID=1223423 RepID=A0A4Y6V4G5_9PROT|nr:MULTISPECIES: glycosyltransferase family 4 protein [Neokomagataea]QDH24234.1 glycosyltransferase [Neokomagataea tanensis]GBR52879.1 lipopolysaccharide core biosynthesis glycosyl transferase [Neokomagataea thailandica NBRC 106555]